MLTCQFDGGLDLVRMISIDCALEDLPPDARSRYISFLKNEKSDVWNAYVKQKKSRRIIIYE